MTENSQNKGAAWKRHRPAASPLPKRPHSIQTAMCHEGVFHFSLHQTNLIHTLWNNTRIKTRHPSLHPLYLNQASIRKPCKLWEAPWKSGYLSTLLVVCAINNGRKECVPCADHPLFSSHVFTFPQGHLLLETHVNWWNRQTEWDH